MPHWGPTVLLLHDWLDTWKSWIPVIPYMPTDVHVLAMDLRGHGDSSKPAYYMVRVNVLKAILFRNGVP
jgi:pimeloyl-ACP methyl ester carboxylesterase